MTDPSETAFLGLDELARHLGVARETARLWLEAYQAVTGETIARGGRNSWLVPLGVADLLQRAVALTRETDLPRDEAIRAELHSPPPGGGLEEALVTGLSEALDERLQPFLAGLEGQATRRLEGLQAQVQRQVDRYLRELGTSGDERALDLGERLTSVTREAAAALDGRLKALAAAHGKGVAEIERTARHFDLAERELIAVAGRLDEAAIRAHEATLALRTAINDLNGAQRRLAADRTTLARLVSLGAGITGVVGAGSVAVFSPLALAVAQHGVLALVALVLGLAVALVAALTLLSRLLR